MGLPLNTQDSSSSWSSLLSFLPYGGLIGGGLAGLKYLGLFNTKSPAQEEMLSLYNMAKEGKTPFDDILRKSFESAKSSLRSQAANQAASSGEDIASEMASLGIAPGAGVSSNIAKAKSDIYKNEDIAETNLYSEYEKQRAELLRSILSSGMSGLKTTSPFADFMATLTTMGNLGKGIAQMGGNSGFNWWGS